MNLDQEQITIFDLALSGRQFIPFNITKSLHEIQQADKNSVERILFEYGGVSVCAAYMFIKAMVDRGPGRTLPKLRDLLKLLNESSVEALEAIAVQLKGMMIMPHRMRVESLFETSRSRAIKNFLLTTPLSDGRSLRDSEHRNTPTDSLPSTSPILDSKQVSLFYMAIGNRKKLPYQCTAALKQASEAGIKTTENIFFNYGGLAACAAYVLTKHEVMSRSNFKAKGPRAYLLKLIEQLPVEARQSAAVQLATAIEPHKAHIVGLVDRASDSKRARVRTRRSRRPTTPSEEAYEDSDTSLRNPNECPATLPSTRKSSSEPAHQALGHSASQSRHDDLPQPPQQDAPHLHNHNQPLLYSSSANNDKRTFTNASIAACNNLFPDYLVGAIKRNSQGCTSAADTAITFPHSNNWKAFLSIKVTPKKIEHIAWELFGVRLENEGGFRYACTGLARVLPGPKFSLKCCRLDPISSMFGEQMKAAISASPVYQQERLRHDNYTNCIMMVVPVAADDCADILISLHPREGTHIKNLLFPPA